MTWCPDKPAVNTAQLLLPVPVGLDLVHEHGPVLAAVPGQIALPITVEVQPPRHHRAPSRPLPHGRAHRPAMPGHILRQAHIHRQQAASPAVSGHRALLYPSAGPGDRAQPPAAALVLASAVVTATGYPSPRTRSHPAALEVSLRDLACLVFVAGSPGHLNGRARPLSPGARGRDEPAPWFLMCLASRR